MLELFDTESDSEASAFDELPSWAAPFGLALLEHVRMRPRMTVLDVGCGAGFPLFELALRLGPSATWHSLDPWPAALRRATFKRDFARLAPGPTASRAFVIRFITICICVASARTMGRWGLSSMRSSACARTTVLSSCRGRTTRPRC